MALEKSSHAVVSVVHSMGPRVCPYKSKGILTLYFSHETVSKLLREGLNEKEIDISVVHSLEHTDGAYLNEAYENDADDF